MSAVDQAALRPAPQVPRPGLLSRMLDRDRWAGLLQLGPVTIFLGFFFVAPLAIFLLYSFWSLEGYDIVTDWTFGNYTGAVSDEVYRTLVRNTLVVAGATSVATIAIAYAFAHALRFHLRRWQETLLLLVVVAMFSGYLVRIYAWRTLLGSDGIVNEALQAVGIIDQPLSFLLFNRTAAIIVLTNFALPLAILPIYAALQNVRDEEIEAARDLGCNAARAFRRVTLPLAWPGIFFAFALTFAITAGDYVVPQFVGGASGTMVGKVIADTFTLAFDWPRGAALAFLTLISIGFVIVVVRFVGWRIVR
jgi:spermidine/putrescine transport system permease protein